MSQTAERNIPAPSGPWMRYPAAAEYTGLPESTMRKLVMDNRVPHRKVGRAVLFSAIELDRWINEGGAATVAA